MPIVFDSDAGTITGLSVGGLPDGIVDSGTLAANSVDSSELVDGAVDNSHLADNAVDSDQLADNAVGLAQMAGGTDGNIITYDTSGNPAVVATGSAGQVLTSAGADAVPTMATLSAGKVLQVKLHNNETQSNSSSTSWNNAAWLNITPSSGTNILLVFTLYGGFSHDSGAAVRFRRGTTEIEVFPASANSDSASHATYHSDGTSGGMNATSRTFYYIDTSHGGDGSTAITYEVQRRCIASSATVYFQYYGSPSSLLAYEIGA